MACLSRDFCQLASVGMQAFLLIFRSGYEDGHAEISEDGEGKRHSPTPVFPDIDSTFLTEVSYILPLS